jgi:hypothetical protein
MEFLKHRRLPWDATELTFHHGDASRLFDKVLVPEASATWPRHGEVIYLQGRWLVDPARATSEATRQFMWAGLRVLRAEAKARGLPEEQVERLIVSVFDTFHDAADSIWNALKAIPVIHNLPCNYVSACPSWHSFENLAWFGLCGHAWPGESLAERERETCSDEDKQAIACSDRFVACEEDRPVPIRMPLSKPMKLLDPDAEILASFEP